PESRWSAPRPARWAAEDVVRTRTHALTRNAISEVQRANVLKRADLSTDLLRCGLAPMVEPHFADGITPADVPMVALDLFKLATAPVSFDPARLSARLDEAWTWIKATEAGSVERATVGEGSNHWVGHGSRTAHRGPILGQRTYPRH